MNIACEWGGESDGSFDYDEKGTDPKDQKRDWTLIAGGEEQDKIFTDWEDLEKANK